LLDWAKEVVEMKTVNNNNVRSFKEVFIGFVFLLSVCAREIARVINY